MDNPDPGNIFPQLLLILVLTLINAFFAAAEIAVVSVSKGRIKALAEEGNKRAKVLKSLTEEPTKFLSTIQVAITLAGFFSSASAATSMSDNLGGLLAQIGLPYGTEIAVVVITILLSFFTLVFGELVPKRIALQRTEGVALFVARPVAVFKKIFSPFVKLLSVSTNLVLRLFGVKNDNLEDDVTKEEIRSLVEEGGESGVIKESECNMIDGIFEFEDIIAEEIMTPRTDVFMVNIERPLPDYIDELLMERYSRIPVFEGEVDNIIGILHIRDFTRAARKYGFEQVDTRSLLRPAYFVPERKKISELFVELQRAKTHMAVLIDEYGGFSGIVTIEDLIEEIMGEIDDEFDEDEPDIRQLDASTWRIRGSASITEINEELELELNEDSDDYDTLGGLIINLLGAIPADGYTGTVEYENLTLKIEEVREKRIEWVKLYVQPDNGKDDKAEEEA